MHPLINPTACDVIGKCMTRWDEAAFLQPNFYRANAGESRIGQSQRGKRLDPHDEWPPDAMMIELSCS
jgi:hypothetical protein